MEKSGTIRNHQYSTYQPTCIHHLAIPQICSSHYVILTGKKKIMDKIIITAAITGSRMQRDIATPDEARDILGLRKNP
jgi:hypothetical protein